MASDHSNPGRPELYIGLGFSPKSLLCDGKLKEADIASMTLGF